VNKRKKSWNLPSIIINCSTRAWERNSFMSFGMAWKKILEFPEGWRKLDDTFRRYRMRRFPYGIEYRIDAISRQILVISITHLSRDTRWRH
jgi:hypothetical protein